MGADINLGGNTPPPGEGKPDHPLQPAQPGVAPGALSGDGDTWDGEQPRTPVEESEQQRAADAPPPEPTPEPEPEPEPQAEPIEPPQEPVAEPEPQPEPAAEPEPEPAQEPQEGDGGGDEGGDGGGSTEGRRGGGGSPSRQYLIFEEAELADLVHELIGSTVAPGVLDPVVGKLRELGPNAVFSRRSFDQSGRGIETVEARNGANALRAAGRLIGQGYEGVLVPVPENSWRPRQVSTRPREGMAVDVG